MLPPRNMEGHYPLYIPLKRTVVAAKSKSKVNQAGVYTKPGMRKALFNKIKAGSKGGDPGEWSARKAQLLAKEYASKGGGYKTKK